MRAVLSVAVLVIVVVQKDEVRGKSEGGGRAGVSEVAHDARGFGVDFKVEQTEGFAATRGDVDHLLGNGWLLGRGGGRRASTVGGAAGRRRKETSQEEKRRRGGKEKSSLPFPGKEKRDLHPENRRNLEVNVS